MIKYAELWILALRLLNAIELLVMHLVIAKRYVILMAGYHTRYNQTLDILSYDRFELRWRLNCLTVKCGANNTYSMQVTYPITC